MMKCNDKHKIWPIRPDHITIDGKQRGLTGPGIISSRHLQGIQSEICHAVQHPTTIVEFPKDEDVGPVRTDSPLITYAMHPSCSRFRKGNLKKDEDGRLVRGYLCLQCDNYHARLLRGLNLEELNVATVVGRKEQDSDLKRIYAGAPACSFEAKLCGERLVVEYDCPQLGYRELIFPILFKEKVIGVFFLGQITLEGHQQFIEDMIKSLPGRFDAHKDGHYGELKASESIADEILQEHRRWLNEDPKDRIVSPERYEEIIHTAHNELKNFEKLLVEEIEHRQIAYIRQHVSRELEEFAGPYESLGQRRRVDKDPLEDLWGHVENSMNRLVDSFSLRYALVFGVKRTIQTPEDRMKVVARTKRWKEVFDSEEDIQNLSINTEGLPDSYMVCSEHRNEQYLECLQGGNLSDLGDYQVAFVPVAPYPHSSIAILLGYDKDHPRTADENQPGGVLDTTLYSFYTLIVSSVAAILARGAEDKAKKQLLYLGHEAGQLLAGIDWLRMTYLADPSQIKRRLDLRKIQDICQDLEGFIGQMHFIFDIAAQIGSDVPPKADMTEFKPFGEILFKWRDTYRREIEKKFLQIRVAELNPRDPLRPAIYADKFLFEQVVYNLVNNAEKYCYRGTKIDLDCRLRSIDEDRSPHVLTVTNYGRYMPPGRELYLPFAGRETAGDVKGLGLGLYIAWLIVEKVHCGKISHDCEKYPISWFNIPLIKPYIERLFVGKDPDILKKVEAEDARLKAEYDSIVAYADMNRTFKYTPTNEVLCNEIRKPTYKVTMTVTIPVQERRNQ